MLEAEIDDILRELLRAPGALQAQVAPPPPFAEAIQAPADIGIVRRPLIMGAELVVTISAVSSAELEPGIDQAARDLIACIRRYAPNSVPTLQRSGRIHRSRAALLQRAKQLLDALAAMRGAACALLLRRNEVIALGGDAAAVDLARRERLPFLRKRIDAEAARQRGRSSHAEVIAEDVYARSFWFDAYLVIFFDSANGWSLDFVRHRVRAACRLLAVILPHLDDEPPAPANVRPLPPRGE